MTLQVFTTGRGTPYGLAAAPVIKVSTRTELARRWKDLIDFDAGRIATGEKTIEETGWDLFRLILDVASGRTQAVVGPLGHPQRPHAVQSGAGDLSALATASKRTSMSRITTLRTIRIAERPNLIWVEIETDEGLTGLGEILSRRPGCRGGDP